MWLSRCWSCLEFISLCESTLCKYLNEVGCGKDTLLQSRSFVSYDLTFTHRMLLIFCLCSRSVFHSLTIRISFFLYFHLSFHLLAELIPFYYPSVFEGLILFLLIIYPIIVEIYYSRKILSKAIPIKRSKIFI